jgi:hypothetical protein
MGFVRCKNVGELKIVWVCICDRIKNKIALIQPQALGKSQFTQKVDYTETGGEQIHQKWQLISSLRHFSSSSKTRIAHFFHFFSAQLVSQNHKFEYPPRWKWCRWYITFPPLSLSLSLALITALLQTSLYQTAAAATTAPRKSDVNYFTEKRMIIMSLCSTRLLAHALYLVSCGKILIVNNDRLINFLSTARAFVKYKCACVKCASKIYMCVVPMRVLYGGRVTWPFVLLLATRAPACSAIFSTSSSSIINHNDGNGADCCHQIFLSTSDRFASASAAERFLSPAPARALRRTTRSLILADLYRALHLYLLRPVLFINGCIDESKSAEGDAQAGMPSHFHPVSTPLMTKKIVWENAFSQRCGWFAGECSFGDKNYDVAACRRIC